jgi:predicted nucleic acid-binding protein
MTEAIRGVLETSVLIDHDLIAAEQVPDEAAITSVSLAELAAGPHATENLIM